MPTRNPPLGFVLVVMGASLFIVNAGVSRVALRAGVDPAMLTTIRLTGTWVLLLVVAAVWHRSALRPPRGRLALLLLLHGVVGVAALQWTYFVAIDRLPIGMALLLEYQAPILVALWARLVQREHVRPRMWLGLALAWGGLAAATGVWRGLSFDVVGVLAGAGAAVCLAAYFLIGEHGVGQVDPLRVVFWSFLTAAVSLNLTSPLTHLPAGILGRRQDLLGIFTGVEVPVWLLLASVIVLGSVLPFLLELTALRHLRATTVTMVAMIEPVGVAALGWVWFHESLGLVGALGAVVVVGGILLAQTARRAPELVPPSVALGAPAAEVPTTSGRG